MQLLAKPNPKPMLPFIKQACLECTTTCPKWCYDGLFPPSGPPSPPPPLTFPDVKSQPTPTFSPLVIAIIGILASAFLLVSYYAIISKYCGNSQEQRQREFQQSNNNEEIIEDDLTHSARHDLGQHEPWLIITPGLDEALIKSITMVKYKKGDGLVGSSDCSVCLGEFLEDDTLRLLPKCCHAFHVSCIDTWLRSHSNCPLCRANIISTFANPPPLGSNLNLNLNPLLAIVVDNHGNNNSNGTTIVQDHNNFALNQVESENIGSIEEGRQMGFLGENMNLSKINQFRAQSDLGVRGYGGRDTIRRSISMDEEDCMVKICGFHDRSLKMDSGESESSKIGVCNCVKMKRSFSSGRVLLSKYGTSRNAL